MKHFSLLCFALALLPLHPAAAQQHRATHLGNPATRFAPPISTPGELRSRFSDPTLRPDIASILRQRNWQGDLADLFNAAASNQVTELAISVGTRMPFMSSRENGRPVALEDVLWAGKEPVQAYAFEFTSKGRFYRCITPRPCSNFYLEDLGAPALSLECQAPAEVPFGRPAEVCLTVKNTGSAFDTKIVVSMPVPPGAVLSRATENGTLAQGKVAWELPILRRDTSKQLCAVFTMAQPGTLPVSATAVGTLAPEARTSCETKIVGIPALLIDAVDLDDPVEVGREVTYNIKVTNQGSIPCTNLRLVCTLPDSESFVSGSGPTAVQAEGREVKTGPITSFAPKSVVTWSVTVKVLSADDARFKVNLHADEFKQPIYEEESTHLY